MEHKLELEDFRHSKYKYEPKPGELRLVQDNNMWGYADDNGNIVIPGQFHIANEFHSRDYAVVMKDGYYGIINKNGETVIPFEYHNMLSSHLYNDNYIIVHKYHKRGVINLKNEILIPIEYDHIFQYGPNVFRVKVGKKYGLINDKGEMVVPIIYDSIDRMGYNSGIYRLKLDNKHGLFNINGKDTGLIYDYIVRTSDKLIRVQIDGKWGFVNQNFEEVIPAIYERAWDFEDNFALVKEDGEWYFLFYMSEEDKIEQKKKMKEYSWLYRLSNKVFHSFRNYYKISVEEQVNNRCLLGEHASHFVRTKKGDLYVHDYITARNESALVPIEIDEVIHFDDNGYAEVRKDGKYGLINTDGEFVIPCMYDELRRLNNVQHAAVRVNDKWGAVDLHNNTLIEFVYDDAFDDKDNYVIVVQEGKMGCIGILDKAGVNIPCKYDMIGHFNEKGYTAACIDGKWGVIDVDDNVLAPFIYDRANNSGYKDAMGLSVYSEGENHLLSNILFSTIEYKDC
ncbi:MAG: WG repeat-containing protein [Paludibacteraceae bacterium]|nr:WG repeat-containing protein [Paludibacteraceae bacterium]